MVRDNQIKSRLADALTADPTISDTNLFDNAVRAAPVVIVACAELGKSGYREGKLATDKGDWYMFDVALAAHSLGLGTVHVGGFNAKKVASILGVLEGFCVVSMTPLGYPDQEPKLRPRKELSEIVSYDKYSVK